MPSRVAQADRPAHVSDSAVNQPLCLQGNTAAGFPCSSDFQTPRRQIKSGIPTARLTSTPNHHLMCFDQMASSIAFCLPITRIRTLLFNVLVGMNVPIERSIEALPGDWEVCASGGGMNPWTS